ncbi:MAG: ABC transporter permease [Coriobacteriales bacterium]|nr:ABC transporter permease [Coriobacteriales bacterium]
MDFARRAALSIVRRPGKSLILFLVVLIIGNLIAGTVAVRQAIVQSEEAAKQALGANVSLGMDDQKLMEAYNRGEEPTIEYPDAALIEELGQRPEVRSFDYSLGAYLLSRTLKNYQPPESEGGVASAIAVGPDADSAYFTLRGIRYAPVLPIEEGKLSLVEGRVFTDADISEGRMVAIVPDVVAETNNLHVGDTVVLVNEIQDWYSAGGTDIAASDESGAKVAASHDVVLEVIGIFARNSGADDLTGGDKDEAGTGGGGGVVVDFTESELYSTLYVPIKVAQAEDEFNTEEYRKLAVAAGEGELWSNESYTPYYTPVYLLNSIDDLESFEQAASARLPEYYKVLSATSQYEQVAGPMRDIQNIMSVALVVVVVVALAVVSLVVVLFLRDRRKEFGIYLSLGARRPLIVSQVLIEVLVVAIVALGIALFTGSLVSGGLSQQMVDNQLMPSQGAGDGMMISAGSYLGGDAGLLMDSISAEDVAAGYRVSLSVPYVLTFLGLGVGVTALSCVVPLLYVLRLKPKKILM